MYERAEDELGFYFGGLDAALGVSGIGFEGGSVSVWDSARSDREHLARWWGADRQNVPKFRRIAPLVRLLALDLSVIDGRPMTDLALAAWSTCSAGYSVATHFTSGEFSAPLVGLGLIAWRLLKPDDTRPPSAIVQAWDGILKSSPSVLGPVKRKAIDLYEPVVARYEALRAARDEANGTAKRARAELRRLRIMAWMRNKDLDQNEAKSLLDIITSDKAKAYEPSSYDPFSSLPPLPPRSSEDNPRSRTLGSNPNEGAGADKDMAKARAKAVGE